MSARAKARPATMRAQGKVSVPRLKNIPAPVKRLARAKVVAEAIQGKTPVKAKAIAPCHLTRSPGNWRANNSSR